jgi:MerR family transcriptional regulator, thiopeptide resistance regulator
VRGYTVSEVAKLSGVSIRALHHYDEIGLLKPADVGANGYRYYGREELLRLQQILFHRELGFPLDEIGKVLDAPDFDRVAALKAHRAKLEAQARRTRRLVRTIDETLAALQGATTMDDKAMYRGFDPERQAGYEAWLVERYGGDMQARIDASKVAIKGATQADFDRMMAEADEIEAAMAQAMVDGLPAASEAVQAIVARHCAWVGGSWSGTPTKDAYIGLASTGSTPTSARATTGGPKASPTT